LRISVHREIPQDQKLRDQWNALVLRMECPEVFYTFEWALAVDRAYRSSSNPLLFLGYDNDVLIGVASLATDNPQKRVSFLAGTTADYCDFVCQPERRREFAGAVFKELAKLSLPILRLANLPEDSGVARVLKDVAGEHGYLVFSRPAYQCARIAFGSSSGDSPERQKLKQAAIKRKAFRYCVKNLEKSGPVTIDHLTDWEAVRANLDRFIAAHVNRFETGGRNSNLASAERQAFLAGLAELLADSGWFVLTRLLLGAEPVAWNYGFRFAGSWFYYQPTFDARWRQFSPGFCLLTKMVEQACDDPTIRTLDLGLGEEEYKDRFASGHRQTLHATITNSATVRLRESMRYHAATAVKSSPRLEHWVRRLVGRPATENVKA
jgi:CelD/BcsL family acetyltransferase involved in cellulose biosynthesis